jgi:uncharacterized membrane protein YgaE (UPF0421/DUF939 family)
MGGVLGWVAAILAVGVILAVSYNANTRGKRGAQRVWWLSVAAAAGVTGVLQGAEVQRPWPLVALVVFVVLVAGALRADRRAKATHGA